MSGLCGWSEYGESVAANRELLARMSAPVRAHNAARFESSADMRSALAGAGSAAYLHFYDDAKYCIAIYGAPLLSGALAQRAKQDGVARAAAQALCEDAALALTQIGGSFVLCVIDRARARTLLAVDRNATYSLAYTIISNALVYSSNQDCINIHPAVSIGLDHQSIYNYVFFHMVPGARTVYRDQQRLAPGQFLEFAQGKARIGAYWKNGFSESEGDAFPQLKEQFFSVLRTGVRDSAADADIGAFLSGGTDSSTVAGLLTELKRAPAHTYSIGFSAQGYDEMDYARIAVRHFKTDHHEYYVTADDIVTAVSAIAQIYDQPFGNSSAVPTYFCAKFAREDGRERILGGDGGDELFGGNERYAKQRVFEHYQALPGALRSALIEPVTALMPNAVMPLRKLRSYVQQARVPMPKRLETYNLLERFGAANVFDADFLRSVDFDDPTRLQEKAYNGTNARSMLNKMLALDHQFTLADNDLPKVTKMCELAGIDVAFPLLHDEVVSFAARLRPELKLKGKQLRYFFKEALRGFLPDEIITKQKHGFGLPFGPWLQTHPGLQSLVQDSLSSLKNRHIVRADFLGKLTTDKVAEHPGYYGTMVWVLMMLELWFQHHAGKRAPH